MRAFVKGVGRVAALLSPIPVRNLKKAKTGFILVLHMRIGSGCKTPFPEKNSNASRSARSFLSPGVAPGSAGIRKSLQMTHVSYRVGEFSELRVKLVELVTRNSLNCFHENLH